MPSKCRARGAAWTLNNPPADADVEKLKELDYVSYGIVAEETGSETGTLHWQAYFKFKGKKSTKAVTDDVERLLGKRPFMEAARKPPLANKRYCSKDGKIIAEWGDVPKQGKRTDLEAAFAAADSDKPMIEVAREHKSTFIRYHRGIEKVRELHNKEKAEDWREVEVIFITGPTGCGKTRQAMAGEESVYKIQGDQLAWWDGYEQEKTIVIDEYSNDIKITKLLGLLDGYKLRLPVKGGFTYAGWTKVYITSNLEELHEQAKPAHRDALARRITTTINMWKDSAMAPTASAMEYISDDFIFQ